LRNIDPASTPRTGVHSPFFQIIIIIIIIIIIMIMIIVIVTTT